MSDKKRLILYTALVIAASFLAAQGVSAGYCLNPDVQPLSYYCSETTEQLCCGGDCPTGQYSTTLTEDCDLGCCFALSGSGISVCNPGATYRGLCLYEGGTFATSCSSIPECAVGCCCWEDDQLQSDINFRGECDNIADSSFNSTITTVSQCSEWCDTTSGTDPTEPDPECNDGVDNDRDGKIDYPDDPGCTDTEDDDETDPNMQCQDGIDNDGDGDADSADSCCSTYPDKKENFCDIDECTVGEKISSSVAECRCYDAYACIGGEYCCQGGCYDVPCGDEECTSGARQSCGNETSSGCELFRYCTDGVWSEDCKPDPLCGIDFEVCDDGLDNNEDGFTDCYDIVCHGVRCDPTEESCMSLGYQDPDSGNWKCCHAGELNDCYGDDGVMDTCGACDCMNTKPEPSMLAVEKSPGEDHIAIRFKLNCDVPLQVYRCVGDCAEQSDFTELNGQTYERQIIDESIQPDMSYCYFVQADYPADPKRSDMMCINTGDKICMRYSTTEFCVNETGGLAGSRNVRAKCDMSNNLEIIEDCEETKGEGYYCIGPYPNKITKCIYQSPCDECGEPLNMFADYATGMTLYRNPLTGEEYELPCKDIPTCYYDYSETSIDLFDECIGVEKCYQYRSESACEGQQSDATGSNNKCLARDCYWEPVPGSLDLGICKETIEEYQECMDCNLAENNLIFDHCDLERCSMFGDCYLANNGRCIDSSRIICLNYLTESECTGGVPVQVDAEYSPEGERYAGTNRISTPSNDAVGIGLCLWDPIDHCYKDADGDSYADAYQKDVTPPTTRIIGGDNTRALNLTFHVSDVNPDSRPGTGVMRTFICMDDSAPCYPTEEYVPVDNIVTEDFTGDHGQHEIYFYSEDNANNLEIVRHETVGVDRQPPQIDIEWHTRLDVDSYTNSSAYFLVTVSENATCYDSLEGRSKIEGTRGWKWTLHYSGLSDGTYQYKVECTDDAGNYNSSFAMVRIDADSAAYDPRPRGKLDYSPVTLSIKTLKDSVCRWGPEEAVYGDLPNTFLKSAECDHFIHTSVKELAESKTYSYDVKCNVDGRVTDDEIEFIYDIEEPSTSVVDMFGDPFDFSLWYSGIGGNVYLECEDTPENGFGCNKTYYCVDTAECTPETLNDPLRSVDYSLNAGQDAHLCYYSEEKSISGFGGRREGTVCKTIEIDSFSPRISFLDIGDHNRSDNPYYTHRSRFILRGEVIDPDTDSPDNVVRISVTNSTGGGSIYENISANTRFSKEIALGWGLNIVTVHATDRSGATTVRYLYIEQGEYLGQKITLVLPNRFGVSQTNIFDLRVRTYAPAECRYSINDAPFDMSGPMDPTTEPFEDGYNYYHTTENYELDGPSEVKSPVYIKCKDSKGRIFSRMFELSWDDSIPVIEDVWLDNSDGNVPPTVIEYPLKTNVLVKTDDEARCRFSETVEQFAQMTKFDGYDNQSLKTTNSQLFDALEDQTTYVYHLLCENGAGLISGPYTLTFHVDTTAGSGFVFLSPDKKSSNTTFVFKIRTTKSTTDCKFGTSENPTRVMSQLDNKTHISNPVTLPEGIYTYHFECLTYNEKIKTTYSFTIDTSPPSAPVIDDGNISKYLKKLSAKWESSDNLSSVESYNFSIGTSPGEADVYGWHTTDDDRETVYDLNLTDKTTYYWSVKAKNEVGLWSSTGHSDGVIVAINPDDLPLINLTPDDSCYNDVLDEDESDIDCGGSCSPCPAGSTCEVDSDCESKNCKDGICQEATCYDNIQNQDESDIDCGGRCDPCALGMFCNYDSDCNSSYCFEGMCAEPSCTDGVQNGDEEGVDCGGSCPDECSETEGCMVDGMPDSDCDRIPDAWEQKYGTDMYIDDSEEDMDGDGYSNYEEYVMGTDPTVPNEGGDADDGWSIWWWILIIILLLLLLAGGGYYYYTEYVEPEQKKGKTNMQGPGSLGPPRPMQRPMGKPVDKDYIRRMREAIRRKRMHLKSLERGQLLEEFSPHTDEDKKAAADKKAADEKKTSLGAGGAVSAGGKGADDKGVSTGPAKQPKQNISVQHDLHDMHREISGSSGADKGHQIKLSSKEESALKGLEQIAGKGKGGAGAGALSAASGKAKRSKADSKQKAAGKAKSETKTSSSSAKSGEGNKGKKLYTIQEEKPKVGEKTQKTGASKAKKSPKQGQKQPAARKKASPKSKTTKARPSQKSAKGSANAAKKSKSKSGQATKKGTKKRSK